MSDHIVTEETISRDELISNYLEQNIPDGKSFFCRYFRRGCCLFSAKDCKFAHGCSDLQFKRLDPNDHENLSEPKKPSQKTLPKVEKENADEDDHEDQEGEEAEELERGKKKQPSLGLELSFKDYYEHQLVLKERGEKLERIYTLDEINLDKDIRRQTRQKFYKDLQQSFMDFLYTEYGTKALSKAFIKRCFNTIDWVPRWRYIDDKTYAYETKSPTGLIIVKQLQGKAFDDYMESGIVKIIKDKGLIDKLPISSSQITKEYYQYICPSDPFSPSHFTFLRLKGIKSIDEYLEGLQQTGEFRARLAEACGLPLSEIANKTIFNNTSNQLQSLMDQIEKILTRVIEESNTGFISYFEFENKVMNECRKALHQFNNNIPQIKKAMVKLPLQKDILVINLGPEVFLLSLKKFKESKIDKALDHSEDKLSTQCALDPTHHPTAHKIHELRLDKIPSIIPDRQTEDFLDKEIDLKKVVTVDNMKDLAEAVEYLKDKVEVGIDLEGKFKKSGRLDLVQCSSGEKIFIFDVHKAKRDAKTEQKEAVDLYKQMSLYIKDLIEDQKTCKIFHDGRKDSLAFHIFLDACPSNVFDLSAVYMLIEHLEDYKSQMERLKSRNKATEEQKIDSKELKKGVEKTEQEGLNLVEELKLPGLNEVLEKYKTSHGLNRLKDIMKSRFQGLPIEYFLQRPIDKEFLIYSAKDVEDLVEVKVKMVKRLKELLVFFLGDVDEAKVEYLCRMVSRSYAVQGCKEFRG